MENVGGGSGGGGDGLVPNLPNVPVVKDVDGGTPPPDEGGSNGGGSTSTEAPGGSAVWLSDFFADTSINWRNAITEASIVFQDYNENVSKQLAISLTRLKEANKELRILTEAQDTIAGLKQKLEKISLAQNEDEGGEAENIVLSTDYERAFEDTNDGDKFWRIQDHGGGDIDIPSDVDPISEQDVLNFQKAIAAIRYYTRDTESGELSLKAGQNKIDTVFGDDGGEDNVLDLESLRALEGVLDNQVEALSPLTTQLANKSQNVQTQSQTASNATSQFIELRRNTVLPFFQK